MSSKCNRNSKRNQENPRRYRINQFKYTHRDEAIKENLGIFKFSENLYCSSEMRLDDHSPIHVEIILNAYIQDLRNFIQSQVDDPLLSQLLITGYSPYPKCPAFLPKVDVALQKKSKTQSSEILGASEVIYKILYNREVFYGIIHKLFTQHCISQEAVNNLLMNYCYLIYAANQFYWFVSYIRNDSIRIGNRFFRKIRRQKSSDDEVAEMQSLHDFLIRDKGYKRPEVLTIIAEKFDRGPSYLAKSLKSCQKTKKRKNNQEYREYFLLLPKESLDQVSGIFGHIDVKEPSENCNPPNSPSEFVEEFITYIKKFIAVSQNDGDDYSGLMEGYFTTPILRKNYSKTENKQLEVTLSCAPDEVKVATNTIQFIKCLYEKWNVSVNALAQTQPLSNESRHLIDLAGVSLLLIPEALGVYNLYCHDKSVKAYVKKKNHDIDNKDPYVNEKRRNELNKKREEMQEHCDKLYEENANLSFHDLIKYTAKKFGYSSEYLRTRKFLKNPKK